MKIAVIGNCQGDMLCASIANIPSEQFDIECRHIISYEDPVPGDREFVESADRIIFQITDFAQKTESFKGLGSARAKKIAFPLLAANFLYPFAGKAHPLSAASKTPQCPNGHYEGQVSDSHLLKLMNAKPRKSAAAVVRQYLSEDFAKLIDLDRLFEMDRQKIERMGNIAGLNLWPLVERSFRDRPVFWTNVHPAGLLLDPLRRFVLESLDIGLTSAQIDAIAGMDPVDEPLGFVHMPVHPSIAAHFGINWVRPNFLYRYFSEGCFDIQAFITRYANFEYDDGLYKALHGFHSGEELDQVIPALIDARSTCPQSPDVHAALGIAYARKLLFPEALESAAQAVSLAPERQDHVRFLCHLANQASQEFRQQAALAMQILKPGMSYLFSSENNGTRCMLQSGWSTPEHFGVWSHGSEAALQVKVSDMPTDTVDLDIGIYPFVPMKGEDLRVDVSVNQEPQAQWRFQHTDYLKGMIRKRLSNIPVSAVAGAEHKQLHITFRIRNPKTPASAGMGADARPLGVGLHSIKITPPTPDVGVLGRVLAALKSGGKAIPL